MSWVTPPTFTVGEVAASSDLNSISGDLDVLATGSAMFDTAGSVVGTPPLPLAPGWYWQTGFFSGTTDGGGHLTVFFPRPFPNGLHWFSSPEIDDGAGNHVKFTPITSTGSITTNGVTVSVYQVPLTNPINYNVVASTGVGTWWLALGF